MNGQLYPTAALLVVLIGAAGYGLDSGGSNLGRSKKFFFIPQRSDWLRGPFILLLNG
jgi:hypothetical protein